jgi:sialate O-acetylesterase
MKSTYLSAFKYAFILLLCSNMASAKFYLSPIFGDNMVLQRGMHVPIYGTADAGEKIAVVFMGKTYKTTTSADGKWSIKMGSYKAGGPYEMKLTHGTETLSFTNILIGEVWLASGQSNMQFGIQTEKHAKETIANATDQQIHFFYVPLLLSLQPVYEIPAALAASQNARWVVCSPEVLATPSFASRGFSAVGYYFALQIRKSTGAPVGMIGSYRGGTPAQGWMTKAALEKSPAYAKYIDKYNTLVANYESTKAAYPTRLTLYRDSLKTWTTEVGNAYNETLKQWNVDVLAAKAANQTPPVRPKPSRLAPIAPVDPTGGALAPIVNYNSGIVPIVGYGIKGVIWYQGENNGQNLKDALEYKDLFPAMITNWREEWGQGDFPFLYIQLPYYRQPAVTPSENNWPWLREAQQKTLSVTKTGMAVAIDAGEALDIHPTNKLVPANRLALVARKEIYGEKVVAYGPIYKSMKVDGNKIIISFDEIHQGLTAGSLVGDDVVFTNGAELKGFGIAGADHKFVWAKATIVGNIIVITADTVTEPEAVRYNWADNPPGNLYNKDGLPARPFRTDDWSASPLTP